MPRQGQNVYRFVNIPEFPSPVGTKCNRANLIGEINGKMDMPSHTGLSYYFKILFAINIVSLRDKQDKN